MRIARVTRKDVIDAASIAEIMASNVHVRCIETERDCKRCTSAHIVSCRHLDEWECIAAAVGGSQRAVDLYLTVCSALGGSENPWYESDEEEAEFTWASNLGAYDDDLANEDLEVAALLMEFEIPPTYRIKAKP